VTGPALDPHQFGPPATGDDFASYRHRKLQAALAEGANAVIVGTEQAGVATAWSPSQWDSEMLGMAVATATEPITWGAGESLVAEAAAALWTGAAAAGIEMLVLRVPSAMGSGPWIEVGFEVADINIRYRGAASSIPPHPISCRQATADDHTAIRMFASVFDLDHFHVDPRIPKHAADRLYAGWIDNLLAGRADAVLVADSDGIAGFVGCRHDAVFSEVLGTPVGLIDLVATSPDRRGEGFGAALVAAAGEFYRTRGTTLIDVGTQLGNDGASRIYRSSGFEAVHRSETLHGWVGSVASGPPEE
jgi:ribosomal protein S18 acetylase RimI-like enzyme